MLFVMYFLLNFVTNIFWYNQHRDEHRDEHRDGHKGYCWYDLILASFVYSIFPTFFITMVLFVLEFKLKKYK